MTLRRIYLTNAYVAGALGLALCVRAFVSRDFTGAVALSGAGLMALALVVHAVGKFADVHLLRMVAWHFSGAYMIAAIPVLLEVVRGSAHSLLDLAIMSIVYLMSQAFTFESLTRLVGPNWPKREEIQAEWQEQIRQDAAQQERNRLAQELHDSVKQQLFSVQTNLATAQARWETDLPAVPEAIVQARNAAREASAEIGAMLDQLQPSPLDSIGLVEALRRQCEALAHRSGAEVRTSFHDMPPLDPATQTVVFRIGQEALANAGRHARAPHVELELGLVEGGECRLRIHDDGQGMAPNTSEGLGLRSMRIRAAEIGGILTVDSTPGQGCAVELHFGPAAYAADLRKLRRKKMWYHGALSVIFAALLMSGRHDSGVNIGWMWACMGIVETAVTIYHTRKYRQLKEKAS